MAQPKIADRPRDADEFDPDEPGIFEVYDEAHEAKADARAQADFAAGRIISNEAVERWLLSWGTGSRLPRPTCGE